MKNIDLRQLGNSLRNFVLNNQLTKRKIILIRSAESQGNLSGTLTGWMDVRLSDYGRKQAFTLNQELEQYISNFDSVNSSDLRRCYDTAFYAMGFPSDESMIRYSKDLRELNFGKNEGLHYDNLPKEEKEKLADPNYVAPGGEGWQDVKQRTKNYFSHLSNGNHLIFTHGGVITSYLYDYGVQKMVNNCSVIGVNLNDKGELGEVQNVDFIWEFPLIEEDI